MKIILILLISLFLTNCSLNKDSQYWREDVIKKKNNQKELKKILKKKKEKKKKNREKYKN